MKGESNTPSFNGKSTWSSVFNLNGLMSLSFASIEFLPMWNLKVPFSKKQVIHLIETYDNAQYVLEWNIHLLEK